MNKMIFKILLALAFTVPAISGCLSQKAILTVTDSFVSTDGNDYLETKQVLSKDTTVKQGARLLLRKDSKKRYQRHRLPQNVKEDSLWYYVLREKGGYSNNLREGDWEEAFGMGFYRKGRYGSGKKQGKWNEYYQNILCGSGSYLNDKRTGIWKFYSVIFRETDREYLIYDFSADSAVYRAKPVYENYLFSISNMNIFEEPFDAIFPYGGYEGFSRVLGNNVDELNFDSVDIGTYHISLAIRIGLDGQAKFDTINYSTRAGDWRSKSTYELRKIYQNAANEIPVQWIPARRGKEIIKSENLYRSSFSIE